MKTRGQYKKNFEIENVRFDKVVALEAIGNKNGDKIWKCICDCGNICEKRKSHLMRSLKGLRLSCGCLSRRHKNEHPNWQGFGEIHKTHWTKIKNNAKRRRSGSIDFDVSIEYIWNLFLKQDRKCSITGIPLTFANTWHDHLSTASLDRIDSSKGYVEGNVQWVHKAINKMKTDFSQEDFIKWCEVVVNHQKEWK